MGKLFIKIRKNLKEKKKGFTILESILGLALFTIVMSGFSLFLFKFSYDKINAAELNTRKEAMLDSIRTGKNSSAYNIDNTNAKNIVVDGSIVVDFSSAIASGRVVGDDNKIYYAYVDKNKGGPFSTLLDEDSSVGRVNQEVHFEAISAEHKEKYKEKDYIVDSYTIGKKK